MTRLEPPPEPATTASPNAVAAVSPTPTPTPTPTGAAGAASEPIVVAERLTKLFGDVIGLNDITVNIAPGVTGLLGPNGAGKSTFLKLLTGQLKPTEGRIRVLGVTPWNHPELFRRVGLCSEHDAFYRYMTGFDFVATLAQLNGFRRATAERLATTALERVGATAFMRQRIGTYSKGMRQRTKVAQAIVHDPTLIVLDEPLNGTDPVGRRDLINLVRELSREGKSVLVSSHVLHEVQSMTNEFVLMFGGRVLASGNVSEVRALLNDIPHRIRIRCSDVQRLGGDILRELPVSGIELDAATGELSALTRNRKEFFAGLSGVIARSGVAVREIVSQDDNLQAVFNYLVGH